jgi:pyruvate/2-oxoglutarate dehydrogenase complex dihydrolipoamide dehydrogenase (E3) component/uncharacterized membrane protein YdjX (TVP38/TMEM64 family)
MTGHIKRAALLLLLLTLVGAYVAFDLGRFFTLAELKARQEAFAALYAGHRLTTLAGYFLLYVAVTALSLPGAAAMTLAGGALFGFWPALLIVSFASSIGATLAFLSSRFLLRDWVQRRFGERLRAIDAGIEKDGAYYLFSLRLVPLFPFFLINLLLGLTPMRTATFYAVSQLGMLAGTAVFVNAGTRLGAVTSLSGLLSPGLLLSFALLGLFPLLARHGLSLIQTRRALSGFSKPRTFDYNLVVIGAGSAGLVSAYIAAAVKAKVALIERGEMGGDCLNSGCVPSKALLRSAKLAAYARRAEEFGLRTGEVACDFAATMERVQRIVERIAPHDSMERYRALGVDCIAGSARVVSPWSVEVNGRVLTTRNIVVASGARPWVPPIPGLREAGFLTSETLWELREQPRRLVVLGGGPIGCELAQAFARLGSHVTQVERGPHLLPREDAEVSALLCARFAAEGVRVLTGHAALRVENRDAGKVLVCSSSGAEVQIPFDAILVAVGRRPDVSGFGLEELGVRLSEHGTLETDGFLRTSIPTIFCAGDAAGPWQFTHTASHQAWYATVNALFAPFKTFRVDSRVIPWCTFTDPEVARVGLSEAEARERQVPFEVTRFPLAELDRAIAESETQGWVKVLTVPGKDTILGVTIVGPHAGDLIAEYVLAMKHGIGLNQILATIHVYPTLAEANKLAAGVWKREHAPQRLLRWVERYHAWRRG